MELTQLRAFEDKIDKALDLPLGQFNLGLSTEFDLDWLPSDSSKFRRSHGSGC